MQNNDTLLSDLIGQLIDNSIDFLFLFITSPLFLIIIGSYVIYYQTKYIVSKFFYNSDNEDKNLQNTTELTKELEIYQEAENLKNQANDLLERSNTIKQNNFNFLYKK